MPDLQQGATVNVTGVVHKAFLVEKDTYIGAKKVDVTDSESDDQA